MLCFRPTKVGMETFDDHRSGTPKKSFSNASWGFHASLNFSSMFAQKIFIVSSTLQNSLNGIFSFHGRKDAH